MAVSLVLSVPILDAWGSTFVKLGASHSPAARAPWHLLRATSMVAAAFFAVLFVLALAATPLTAHWLSIPWTVYLTGLGTAAAASLWLFAKSTCQGLLAWRRLVFIEVSWSVAILVAPVAARTVLGELSWRIVAVFVLSYLLASLAALPYWLATPREPARPHVRRVWEFGRYLAGASLVLSLLLASDRFLVNAWSGLDAVARYQVYALPSFGAAFFAAGLMNRFLYPLLNRGDPAAFRRLFLQALPWAALSYLPAIGLGTFLALLYLGYPLHPGVLALSSAGSFAFCVMTFLTFLASTNESQGPRVVLQTYLLASAVFFPLTIGLLPAWPTVAPFAGYAVAFGIAAAFVLARCSTLEQRDQVS
jgi:O-antigen/teichoic acid export membrane protein